RRVEPELRQRAVLDLALVDVEDRRALEAVPGVEPDRARGPGPLLLDDVADAPDAAERRLVGVQAEVLVGAVRDEAVREEARVDVGGVDPGHAHVLPDEVGRVALRRAGGGERHQQEPVAHNSTACMPSRPSGATGKLCYGENGMRRAKIVCTLGPSTRSPEMIAQLLDAGMDVARLNFSHGDYDSHLAALRMVRGEAQKRGRPVGILQDLQGPKIRIGTFARGQTELVAGGEFTITTRAVIGDDTTVATTYRQLPHDVKKGDTILLDDGYLCVEVVAVDGEDVKTRVVSGGTLKDKKGINLPGVKVSA